ncbi:hypothetical protein [Pleurocapsa sp. FMAR1]|uniref:hypothetical protein n=1 Tax=Pleurocapsa sp. FMAR1 TaxID=3040204 RepID=UPI0029C75E66|nr:hypothetical protein [Pleurocapsa sp. FMAR1]
MFYINSWQTYITVLTKENLEMQREYNIFLTTDPLQNALILVWRSPLTNGLIDDREDSETLC